MTRSLQLFNGASLATLALLAAAPARAQQALPTIDIDAAAAATAPTPPGFSPDKLALPVYREPTGQTFTSVSEKIFSDTPIFTVQDMLQYSPGMTFKQGNAPRDIGVSIRGSGARNGFGVRNIVVLEDGFSVTGSRGGSRLDPEDPHAYAAIDVYRGPSSALFGNFANGGAINFRTRTGAEIDGVETGHDFGSYGYTNNYTVIGKKYVDPKYGDFDVALFVSDARGDGSTQHSGFNTQTLNMTARWQVTPTDLIMFKGLHNQLYADQSPALSLNQYYINPYQRSCALVPPLATGTLLTLSSARCGQGSVFLNGVAGSKVQVTGDMGGFHRDDRRDLLGLRWEHDLDASTKWTTQASYDDRNIYQPSASVTVADEPVVIASTDVARHGQLMGMPATHSAGLWFNRDRFTNYGNALLPGGNGAFGATTSKLNVLMQNVGGRLREEIALSRDVTGVLGLAVEQTRINGHNESFAYGVVNGVPLPTGATPVNANHVYWNVAPEASVSWRVLPELLTHFRASSGYGAPNSGQVFTNSFGQPGDNTNIKTQRNTGIDIGFDWTPDDTLRLSLTGFHEWYQNEQLTQTAGFGTFSTYTYNAPGSVHRGVEFLMDWRPIQGWQLLANYTYDNQIFTNFTEVLASGGQAANFNRAGYHIPGVAPHELTTRLGYTHPYGDFKGVGAFVEYVYKSSYYVDNGNVLAIPSYGLLNANVHYDRDVPTGPFKSFTLFFEVRNLLDRTYVAAANNIQNRASLQNGVVVQNGYADLAQNQTGSIYAGAPRVFQGGVKFRF
jgi:iron complex outermembrane receptor protein